MSEILSYSNNTSKNGEEDWIGHAPYSDDDIARIKDPDGGLSENPRTAIPSRRTARNARLRRCHAPGHAKRPGEHDCRNHQQEHARKERSPRESLAPFHVVYLLPASTLPVVLTYDAPRERTTLRQVRVKARRTGWPRGDTPLWANPSSWGNKRAGPRRLPYRSSPRRGCPLFAKPRCRAPTATSATPAAKATHQNRASQ